MGVSKVEWHENCLKNRKRSFQEKIKAYEKIGEEIHSMEKEIFFYELQIKTAKKERKEKFDEERYLIKRKNKL